MDKFGIFNLLNSFLNLSSPSSSQQNESSNQENSPSNATPADFLSGILSSLKGNSSTEQPTPENKPTTQIQSTSPPVKPLQKQMLSTMTAHDELIRRVNQNKQN